MKYLLTVGFREFEYAGALAPEQPGAVRAIPAEQELGVGTRRCIDRTRWPCRHVNCLVGACLALDRRASVERLPKSGVGGPSPDVLEAGSLIVRRNTSKRDTIAHLTRDHRSVGEDVDCLPRILFARMNAGAAW